MYQSHLDINVFLIGCAFVKVSFDRLRINLNRFIKIVLELSHIDFY